MFDRHQRHIIACSHFTQKQVFWTIVFMAPRVAKTVHASPTNTHKMSVAALLAASPVSTDVPSDAVSPDVSSLPSPVAQPKTRTPEELGSGLDKAFDDMVEKGCFAGIANLMCGKTPDEMSIEAQAALNKISQPQVPEQAERDGFESQLELAVSSGTVHPKSALGQKFTRSLGEDEKQAIEHDDAFCWIGYLVIECFGTVHVSQNPKHRDLLDIHELR